MKIAYLVHLNTGPKSGVFNKIIHQADCWKKLGNQVLLYVLTREREVERGLPDGSVCFFYSRLSWLDRLRKMNRIVSRIIVDSPNIVYLRQDHCYPAYVRLGKALSIVMEINSDVDAELRAYSKGQWLFNKLTERILWRASSGAVLVTYELVNKKRKFSEGRPVSVIANGIDLSSRTPVEALHGNAPPTLFFLGSPGMAWHGIDKILRLAMLFPEWQFYLVGPDGRGMPYSPPNVHCLGELEEHRYLPLIKASDVALSTLALHRKGMEEACPLKTREYLSFGLPVIIGYRDTDFPGETDFLLRLPNTENNIEINLDRIRDFVYRWKGKRVAREKILRIDMIEKERARIEFFSSILRNN